MDPLVSIVVPCFNYAHLLPQCVNSILQQDYRNFEVLIMDNCSPDNTPEVAQSFTDPRVLYFRNESNLGFMRNFNKGINLTRGTYVWVLMADDMLRTSHVLGRFVELLERNPDVGFVFCRAVELDRERETGICPWADWGDEDRIWKDRTFFLRLIEGNHIVASSVLVRKSCYDKTGLFPLDLPFACDWYMWSLFAMQHQVAYFSEPMVSVRIHDQSLTSSYSKHICVADELSVVWRVGQQAKRTGLGPLATACETAFVRRAVGVLEEGPEGMAPSVSREEFEQILESRFRCLTDIEEIRASVYTSLADRQYRGGAYGKAAQSYWFALTARPWRGRTWAKYLLLRMGAAGVRIRRLPHQLRRGSVRTRYAK